MMNIRKNIIKTAVVLLLCSCSKMYDASEGNLSQIVQSPYKVNKCEEVFTIGGGYQYYLWEYDPMTNEAHIVTEGQGKNTRFSNAIYDCQRGVMQMMYAQRKLKLTILGMREEGEDGIRIMSPGGFMDMPLKEGIDMIHYYGGDKVMINSELYERIENINPEEWGLLGDMESYTDKKSGLSSFNAPTLYEYSLSEMKISDKYNIDTYKIPYFSDKEIIAILREHGEIVRIDRKNKKYRQKILDFKEQKSLSADPHNILSEEGFDLKKTRIYIKGSYYFVTDEGTSRKPCDGFKCKTIYRLKEGRFEEMISFDMDYPTEVLDINDKYLYIFAASSGEVAIYDIENNTLEYRTINYHGKAQLTTNHTKEAFVFLMQDLYEVKKRDDSDNAYLLVVPKTLDRESKLYTLERPIGTWNPYLTTYKGSEHLFLRSPV